MTGRRPLAVGRGNCDCTNITIMQLFHELKQQFPAVPDEVVSSCISDHCHNRPACRARLQRELEHLPRATTPYPPALRMTESVHRLTDNNNEHKARPNTFPSPLNPTSQVNPTVSSPPAYRTQETGKPPISPSSNKRFGVTKNSPTKPKHILTKLEEEGTLHNSVSPNETNSGAIKRPPIRPSTLELNKTDLSPRSSVNLSVNVNCSVDVLATPPRVRKHTSLQITPEPVWCKQPLNNSSPRSYTSVNLTLRTPTSEPQPPIDICSANSSLTYSTSSFNSKQGLQSRLQITVGPSGIGNVTAIRDRPRSSYHPKPTPVFQPAPVRAGSMPDLATTPVLPDTNKTLILVNRQLERKEQLRKELEAGKERLMSIKKEVTALRIENTADYRDKLRKEIRHLQAQCDRLTYEVDRHSESRVPLGETNIEFYRHIYTGQRNSYHSQTSQDDGERVEVDGPRWPCHICTFRNHPLMNKCEQCEMPRILLVSAVPGDNIHIRFAPGNTRRVIHSWVV